MNEDYLWNKTGGDPEIERLENALAAFRYKETAAPAIDAKVLPFKPKPARKIFQFKFAAAACLVFAAIASVVLIQISADKPNGENDSARAVESENVDSIKSKNQKPDDLIIEKPTVPATEKSSVAPIQKTENARRAAESKPIKIKQEISVNNRRRDAKPPINKRADTETRLTDEERYAYKQLLLALSVTSSKLQLVKNKVQSKEEKTVSAKDGR